MKKLVTCMLAFLTLVLSCAFVSCFQQKPLVIKQSDTYIVITVSDKQMPLAEDTTLVEYMQSLKTSGKLEFEIKDGMVTSINHIENPADFSSCWMLYTSDTENANNAWGEIEYDGNVYGSSVNGAERLKIKNGCLYIWVYKSF